MLATHVEERRNARYAVYIKKNMDLVVEMKF